MQVNQTSTLYTQDIVNPPAYRKVGQFFLNSFIGQLSVVANVAGVMTKFGISNFVSDIFTTNNSAELLQTYLRATSAAGGGANNIAGQINYTFQSADISGIPSFTTLARFIYTALDATQSSVRGRLQWYLNVAGTFSEILRLEVPTVTQTTGLWLLRLNGSTLQVRQVKLLADAAAPGSGQQGLYVDTA